MNACDELAGIMSSALHGPKDGTNITRLMADAVLAAGYTKPRIITTVEELAALPDGTVIAEDYATHQRILGGWCTFGGPKGTRPELPATVLHEPKSLDKQISKQIHYVKIVDGQMKFECQDSTAKCHTYPACDCEQWNDNHAAENGAGHETTHHEKCWMQDWFDVPGATYTGDEFTDMTDTGVPADMNREGYIWTSCDGEILEFEFEEDVTS